MHIGNLVNSTWSILPVPAQKLSTAMTREHQQPESGSINTRQSHNLQALLEFPALRDQCLVSSSSIYTTSDQGRHIGHHWEKPIQGEPLRESSR